MKPLKLTIENIKSFRAVQTVDFVRLTSAENIFCISGDTGSGKTTIFDCILLALFGENARGNLDELINLAEQKARVEFEFEADYEGARKKFISERILSRKAGGNRNLLKADGEIIAEGKNATALLGGIIGLSREQFTRVALLEQGKFDEFLVGDFAKRNDMLANLLGLQKYRRAYAEAYRFAEEIQRKIENAQNEQDNYVERGITKENLEEIKKNILSNNAELEKCEERLKAAIETQKSHNVKKERHSTFTTHRNQLVAAEKKLEAAKSALDKLSPFDPIRFNELSGKKEYCSLGLKLLTDKQKELDTAIANYKTASEALREAVAKENEDKSLEKAAADYLKSRLRSGDSCPVCGGECRADGCAFGGETSLANGLNAHMSSSQNIGQLRERADNLVAEGKRRREEMTELTAAYGDRLTLPAQIDELSGALRALDDSRNKRGDAERAVAEATGGVTSCKASIAILGEDTYDEKAAQAADKEFASADLARSEVLRQLTAAEKTKSDIERDLPKVDGLTAEIAAQKKRHDGFVILSRLFRDNQFYDFVLNEYVNEFAIIASDILQRLSGGLYTLEYEDKEFYIADFMYEGKKRKAKTLSGGETFLASVSIAIAVMKYISGGKSFEFFFLDEGFGTLHEEAVDTVVSALKELSKDVTVGVISHVEGIREGIATRILVKHATETCGSIIETL